MNFLKKVATPIATAVGGPLLGGVIGTLVGSRSGAGGGTPPSQKNYIDSTVGRRDEVTSTLMDQQGRSAARSDELLGGAQDDLNQSRDFFGKLASGDVQARTEFLAPEVADIKLKNRQALEGLTRFGQRGGERARAITQNRTGEASQIGGLVSGARARGSQELAKLAGIGGQIGLGAGNQAINAGQVAGGQMLTGRGQDIQREGEQGRIDVARRGQNIGIANDIGQGVGNFLQSSGLGDKIKGFFGGGNKNGGATGGTTKQPSIAGGKDFFNQNSVQSAGERLTGNSRPSGGSSGPMGPGPVSMQFESGLRASQPGTAVKTLKGGN